MEARQVRAFIRCSRSARLAGLPTTPQALGGPMARATGARALRPTDEQQDVLDNYGSGNGIVRAYAGTGKTATLRLTAQANPHEKFFLVCYNRATADDAKKSFPRNATTRTMHSVAFGSVGVEYKHKLNGPRQRGGDVAAILGIKDAIQIDQEHNRWLKPWQIGMMAIKTVQRYCYSADANIGPQHV